MLNKRCRSILLEIIKQPKTTDELAHLYHVSNRSIRNDLNEINYFLKQNQFTEIKKNSDKRWLLSSNAHTEKIIFEIVNTPENVKISYTKHERILELFYKLSMQDQSIKIDILSKDLMVSKSSVIKDLEDLKKLLNPYSINIQGTNTGIFIQGEEITLRLALLNAFFSEIDKKTIYDLIQLIENSNSITTYNVYWRLFEGVDLNIVKQLAETIKNRFSVHLSDFMYLYLLAAISLMIKREKTVNKNGFNIPFTPIISKILDDVIFDSSEKQYMFYIAMQICPVLYLNQFHDPIISIISKKSFVLSSNIEQVIKRKLNEYERRIIQKELIYIYIEKRILHQEFSHVIELNDKQYNSIYDQIETFMNQLNLPFSFSREDIWRITWHIISWKQQVKSKKQILIVSDKPRSLIQILIQTLKQNFDVNIIGVTSLLQMKQYLEYYNIDYILSTINITNRKDILKVHPLLQKKDIDYLKQYLDTPQKQFDALLSTQFQTCSFEMDKIQDVSELFEHIDQILVENNIVSYPVSKLLVNSFNKVEHPFIYKNKWIMSLYEHEIINQNFAIHISINNRVFKDLPCNVDEINVVFATSIEDYIKFIETI
jgi:mannitol operon transcriptional antiterminator